MNRISNVWSGYKQGRENGRFWSSVNRVRVLGSGPHIPTQLFWEYPPPPELYCKEEKLFLLLVFNKICLPCNWHFSIDVFSKKQMCVNGTHVYRTQLMIVEIMKCYELSRLREVWNGLLKIYFIPRLLLNKFSISQNVGWGDEVYLAYYLSFPHT